jgi:hypothetical protein
VQIFLCCVHESVVNLAGTCPCILFRFECFFLQNTHFTKGSRFTDFDGNRIDGLENIISKPLFTFNESTNRFV